MRELPWWPDEQLSEETCSKVGSVPGQWNWQINVVLSQIEFKLQCKRWYCGHYHTVKKNDKMQFMFKNYAVLPKEFI